MEHASGREHHSIRQNGEASIEVEKVGIVRKSDDLVDIGWNQFEREANCGRLRGAHAEADEQNALSLVRGGEHVAPLRNIRRR